jgi:hypothetical protein
MKGHDTSNVEPPTTAEIAETRHALGLLCERSVQACRVSLALAERVRESCARSRAAREVVTLNRLQWRTWRAGLGAALARASIASKRCVLVRCDDCESVCFAHRGPEARVSTPVEPAAAVWVLPPPAVREWLRTSPSMQDVEPGVCPQCRAHADSAVVAPPNRPAADDLAGELLSVLAELSIAADELRSTASSLDQQEALTRACEAATTRLADSVPPEELAEFAGALAELLRQLQRAGAADGSQGARRDGVARRARFRPSLRRR